MIRLLVSFLAYAENSSSVEDSMDFKLANVYESYQNYLHAINVMDFDDLLLLTE